MQHSNSPQILHIHPGGDVSISALALNSLLSAMDLDQYPPRILLTSDGATRQLFENSGFEVDVMPLGNPDRNVDSCNGAWPAQLWKAFFPNRTLAAYLRNMRPRLVHVHGQAALPAGMTCSRLGLPILWHPQERTRCSDSRFQRTVENYLAAQLSRRVFAPSANGIRPSDQAAHFRLMAPSFNAQVLDKIARTRAAVRRSLALEDSDVVIGMVGCLCEASGVWDFMRTAGKVHANLPDMSVRFMVLATGFERRGWQNKPGQVARDMQNKAWQLAYRNGIENDFFLEEYHASLLERLGGVDILISFPWPGMSEWSALAAMALGVPVVQLGGQGSDHVTPVPAGNMEALAAALTRLAASAELRRKAGQQASHSVRQRIAPERNAQLLEDVYAELL